MSIKYAYSLELITEIQLNEGELALVVNNINNLLEYLPYKISIPVGESEALSDSNLIQAIHNQTEAIVNQSAVVNAAVMQMANILEVIASPDEDLDDLGGAPTSLDQR